MLNNSRNKIFRTALVALTVIATACFALGCSQKSDNQDISSQQAGNGKTDISEEAVQPAEAADKGTSEENEKKQNDIIEDLLSDSSDVEFTGTKGRDDGSVRTLMQKFLEEKGSEIKPEDILSVCCSDLDCDGVDEEFIFTGELVEEDFESYYEGTGWLVTGDSVSELEASETGKWGDTGCFYDFGKRSYYVMNASDPELNTAVSKIWTVSDGKPAMDDMSDLGYFTVNDDGSNIIICNGNDQLYDKEEKEFWGQTWKPYYVYYDEDKDTLAEYGGAQYSVFDLGEACDYDVEGLMEEYEAYPLSAYIRENGILNFNYIVPDERDISFANATYDMNKKEFISGNGTEGFHCGIPLRDSNFDGIYEACFTESNVSYPEAQGFDNMKVQLSVDSPDSITAIGGRAIIYGRMTNEVGQDMGNKAFWIEDDLEYAPDYEPGSTGIADYVDYVKKAATEQGLDNPSGTVYLTATGCHVDSIGSFEWN